MIKAYILGTIALIFDSNLYFMNIFFNGKNTKSVILSYHLRVYFNLFDINL